MLNISVLFLLKLYFNSLKFSPGPSRESEIVHKKKKNYNKNLFS